MMVTIALGIAYTVPLIFLLIVRRFDLFHTGKFYFIVVTVLWGAIAYLIAARINPALIDAGWVSRDQVIRFVAPILEELLKALILIYLVQRADFNYVVDGAIYGFGAGIGFAMFENHEYVLGHINVAFAIAIARVFSTNLVHATGSGVIGTALATRRADPTWKSWVLILLGYAFSMAFHIGFNNMVSAGVFLVFAIVFGFIGLGLIWYAIKRGLNLQKIMFVQSLTDINRTTKNEVKALTSIEKIDELLRPFESQFGRKKKELVKDMLSKQAELGIKTSLLDSASNENQKRDIEKIISDLQSDIGLIRGQIGSYCMMFVRMVYMDPEVKVFDSLTARIAESSTGQKGGGLWDRTSDKIKTAKSEEEQS